MLRTLAHAGAWTAATGAAMAMSWFGVHHVLADTAYDPPRALPVSEELAPASSSATAPTASSPPQGNVHSYPVKGGRVALDLGETSAALVSATPDPGWEMKVWKQPEWIRVDFTSGTTTSSVFCTWNGHPPLVQTYSSA